MQHPIRLWLWRYAVRVANSSLDSCCPPLQLLTVYQWAEPRVGWQLVGLEWFSPYNQRIQAFSVRRSRLSWYYKLYIKNLSSLLNRIRISPFAVWTLYFIILNIRFSHHLFELLTCPLIQALPMNKGKGALA